MRTKIFFGILILAGTAVVHADPINPFESCVNVNGTISDVGVGCEFDGGAPGAGIVDNIVDGLGSVVITLSGVGDYLVSMYVDSEIDEAVNTWFNEFGSTSATGPAAGQTWEIDEPGFREPFGDIYANFLASTLDGTNSVPYGSESDVAMALGWGFSLLDDEIATITFTLSEAMPGGFWLKQSDDPSEYDFFFSSTLNIRSTEPPTNVPEPGTLLLLGSGLFVLGLSRRRIRRH